MSSHFTNVALDFFHGAKVGLDSKTQELQTKFMPIDEKINFIAIKVIDDSSISLSNLLNKPLMNRFIHDLSHEMQSLDFSASYSEELIEQTHHLVSKLLQLPAYEDMKEELEMLDRNTEYCRGIMQWRSSTSQTAQEAGLASSALELYSNKMTQSDAIQILEKLQVIRHECLSGVCSCVKKLNFEKMSGEDIAKILQVMQDPEVLPQVVEWTELLVKVLPEEATSEQIVDSFKSLKDESILKMTRFVVSMIRDDTTKDEALELLTRFPWLEKVAIAEDLKKLIDHVFPHGVSVRSITSFLTLLKSIDSKEQIESLIEKSSIFINPEEDPSSKIHFFGSLVSILGTEDEQILPIIAKYPIKDMNLGQIESVLQCLKGLHMGAFLEVFAQSITPLVTKLEPFDLMIVIQKLAASDCLMVSDVICESIDPLLTKSRSYDFICKIIDEVKSQDPRKIPLILEGLSNLPILHASKDQLNHIVYLLSTLDEYSINENLRYLLQFPLEGMNMSQINVIFSFIINPAVDTYKVLFVRLGKDLVNKDMDSLNIGYVLNSLNNPIILLKGDLHEQLQKFVRPDMKGHDIAAILTYMGYIPYEVPYSVYTNLVEQIIHPGMTGINIGTLIGAIAEIPEELLPIFFTKILDIKAWNLSDNDFVNAVKSLIPSRESISKIALYASGSSVALEQASHMDVKGMSLFTVLTQVGGILNDVIGDLSKKAATKLNPRQEKIKNALLETSKLLEEGSKYQLFVEKARIKADPVEDIQERSEILADKLSKLQSQESLILPYDLRNVDASGHEMPGHAVMLEITKQEDNKYRISIVNTGFGINHHVKIGETTKYYPVVVKDIDPEKLDIEFFKDITRRCVNKPEHDLATQFTDFYTQIKSLGTQADAEGRAYHEQGQIGNCTFKSISKILHTKLGEEYELVKVLMHKKILSTLKILAGQTLEDFDLKNSQAFIDIKQQLISQYGSNPSTIDAICSADSVIRNASFTALMSLPLLEEQKKQLRKVLFTSLGINNAKLRASIKMTSNAAAASSSGAPPILFQATSSLLKAQIINMLMPKDGELPSEEYMLFIAEFLDEEISKTQLKISQDLKKFE